MLLTEIDLVFVDEYCCEDMHDVVRTTITGLTVWDIALCNLEDCAATFQTTMDWLWIGYGRIR